MGKDTLELKLWKPHGYDVWVEFAEASVSRKCNLQKLVTLLANH